MQPSRLTPKNRKTGDREGRWPLRLGKYAVVSGLALDGAARASKRFLGTTAGRTFDRRELLQIASLNTANNVQRCSEKTVGVSRWQGGVADAWYIMDVKAPDRRTFPKSHWGAAVAFARTDRRSNS